MIRRLEAFPSLPPGPFKILVADPPWCFETFGPTGRGRCPDGQGHYEVLDFPVLCSLSVPNLLAPSAVLFLWSTIPHLEQALDLMSHWGLPYRSHWIWLKGTRTGRVARLAPAAQEPEPGASVAAPEDPTLLDPWGTGYWGRSAHEIVLIGARGSGVAPPRGFAPSSVLISPKGRHSAKPEALQDRIDRIYPPEWPRIELFARRARPNWTIWGDEAPTSEFLP